MTLYSFISLYISKNAMYFFFFSIFIFVLCIFIYLFFYFVVNFPHLYSCFTDLLFNLSISFSSLYFSTFTFLFTRFFSFYDFTLFLFIHYLYIFTFVLFIILFIVLFISTFIFLLFSRFMFYGAAVTTVGKNSDTSIRKHTSIMFPISFSEEQFCLVERFFCSHQSLNSSFLPSCQRQLWRVCQWTLL